MLLQESVWLKKLIIDKVKNESLVLNIGSSTEEFVKVKQPYIFSNVFSELIKKRALIRNVDIKPDAGVHFVGDLADSTFTQRLSELKPDVIICSNVLEHLEERDTFCQSLLKLMGDNTLLIITVPHKFPYHADPIDTMYRPSIEDILEQFSELDSINAKNVSCGRYIFFEMNYNKLTIINKLKFLKKILMSGIWGLLRNDLNGINLFRHYFSNISVTCVAFKKSSG